MRYSMPPQNLSSISAGLDLDKPVVPEGEEIDEPCRAKVIGPNALVHVDGNLDKGSSECVIGELWDHLDALFNMGRFSAGFYDFPLAVARGGDPPMALESERRRGDAQDQRDEPYHGTPRRRGTAAPRA